MKRIVYSCLLFILLFSTHTIRAQVFNATVTPNPMCADPSGSTAAQGGVTAPSAGANSYTWSINGPAGTSATHTLVPGATSPGSLINITFVGCGDFTIVVIPATNGVLQPQNSIQLGATVICPTAAIVASSPSICPGGVSALTANGSAVSWTWSPGGSTGGVLNVNPATTTCYTVTGTSAAPASCTMEASTCVTVQPIGVAISPASQTVCAGTTVTLTAITTPTSGTNIQWYNTTGPGPAVALGTGSTQTANPIVPSTYSVLVGYNTCSASATASVGIDTYLSIDVSASTASACANDTFVLTATASALSYTWVAPPPTGTIVGNSTATATVTGPGTYSIYAANGACPGYTTITIPQNVSFTPTITASSLSVCPGETFTLTGTGGAQGTYTWVSFVPPLTYNLLGVDAPNTITATQNVTTIYGFSVTSPGGCPGTASLQVGMNPNYTVTASASAPSVCASSPVTITATGAPTYTFITPAGSFTNTSGVFVDNPTSNTTYTVIGSDAAGYCASTPTTVTVNMLTNGSLTITASSNVSIICPGQFANLSASGALSYTWMPINIMGPTVTVNPSVTTVYTVTGDNNGGCSGSALITLSVSATPTVGASVSASVVCEGFTSTLTAYGAASYTWTGSTFSNPVLQQSISVGPGTYTLQGGSAGAGCLSTFYTLTIGLAPPLNISASQDQYTTCIINNSPKYSKPVILNASGATTYAWFPYNPAYVTYSLGPTTTVRPPTSTCYTVIGATSICTGSAVICVQVIPQFSMQVVPPQPAICLGDSIVLSITNISSLAVGPTSAFTYSWTEALNAPPPSISNILTQTVEVWPQNTTTYSVEMRDFRGCASLPRLVTVTVLPQPITSISLPVINNVITNTVCYVGDIPGAPDNIIVLTAYNGNNNLPFGVVPTYTWLSPYNPTSILTDPNAYNVTVNAPKRLPSLAVYTVVTGYNGIQGCSRMDTVTIRSIDCRPVVSSSIAFVTDVNKDTICTRNCITFMALTDTMAGGPQTYNWTFEGGNPGTSTEKNPTICYDLSGDWNVILKVKNPYPKYQTPPGSEGTVSFLNYVVVVDVPNVTIVPPGQLASDTIIKFGESVVLTGTNALKYHWTSTNYNVTTPFNPKITVAPLQTSQFILTGYNSSKCFSSDTVNVIVIEDCGEMFVPNAFSPNGDGSNDVLKVRGICLETLTFMVFNRWGEKVFETTDLNTGWDGTYHGEKMNTGVFVYRLEGKTYAGKGFSLKGNVTLIR